MDELERLAKEEKLRVLPRMGAKLEEKCCAPSRSTACAAAATC